MITTHPANRSARPRRREDLVHGAESTARFATIRAWLTRSLQFHNPLVQIPGREESVFAADLSSFKQSQGL